MIRCQNSVLSLWMFKVSTASSNTSLQSLWEVFHSLSNVDRSLWQVAPDNLKCFLEFGDCFQLCFKLAVSIQHCTRHTTVHWFRSGEFGGHWSFVMKSGQLAHCALCVLARHPVGRWIRWAADDCSLQRDLEAGGQRNTQNQLLLSLRQNAAVLCHLVTGFWKLDSIFSLNIFNAEKSVGGHVKKSITSFFNRITFHLAVRCRTFQKINL